MHKDVIGIGLMQYLLFYFEIYYIYGTVHVLVAVAFLKKALAFVINCVFQRSFVS